MKLFFREHKLLVVLLVLSVVALLAGLFMIQSENEKSVAINQHNEVDATQVVETMNLMAEIAKQELLSQQPDQTANSGSVIGDIKPQESIDRVAALHGVMPEIGSDDWCEVMMIKDADKWTQEEQSLFAKHCL